MPIKFRCKHCQKALSVKDSLAGKKAACPVCKKPIKIPSPVAEAAALEELAAQSLVDEPPPAAKAAKGNGTAAPTGTIDFTCPFCDAELHLPAEMGGKQGPCPECKKILKIPKLIADRAKDWREVKTGPTAALMNQPKELEGAWGSETSKSKVSREALEEADAIPDEPDEPIGIGGWIKRGVLATILIGVAVFGFITWNRSRTEGRQLGALAKALEWVPEKGEAKLSPLWAAEVHRGACEFYIRAKKADLAMTHLQAAVGHAQNAAKNAQELLEADAILIDLALTITDLGGSGEAVENNEKLDWKDLVKTLERVLGKIQSPDARLVASQELGMKLHRMGQSDFATGVCNVLKGAGDVTPPPLATAGLVAMFLARDKEAEANELLPLPKGDMDPLARIAYADGFCRKGKYDEAMTVIKTKLNQPDSWHAAVAAAASADSSNAKQFVEEAHREWKNARSKKPHPFVVLQFARAGCRVDLAGTKDLLKALPPMEKHLKARLNLECLLVQLEQSKTPEKNSLADEIGDKESTAYAIAIEAIARQRARLGHSPDGLPDDKLIALRSLGIALGDQER